MNKCVFAGNTTREVETKTIQNGDKTMLVARTGLALSRRYSKKTPKEADFINLVAFGSNAEFMAKHFKEKGSYMIIPSARVQTGSYEKDGQKHYTTEFVVEEMEFGRSSKNESSGQTPATPASAPAAPAAAPDDGFMSIPDGMEGLPDGFGDDSGLPWQ